MCQIVFVRLFVKGKERNSRLHTEVGSVSSLSRTKIVYQGVAEGELMLETGMKHIPTEVCILFYSESLRF
jgi:hypothetical protein